jgi:molecular chaperone DnaK
VTSDTVDFGIELGEARSRIAFARGGAPKIIKNALSTDATPSVVYIHPRGEVYVGQDAEKRLLVDPLNGQTRFRRSMVSPIPFRFENGRSMTAEQLTAEVLRSLRSDVYLRLGEDIHAAVIAVPALFPREACLATQRAAKMVGIDFAPLIMEPLAAALAYGYPDAIQEGYIMTYCLESSFDVSLIKIKELCISIADVGGNNSFGDKDIDKIIVNQLVLPKLDKKFSLDGINWTETDRKYGTAYRKLMYVAGQQESSIWMKEGATIEIPYLCKDRQGATVDVDVHITRAEYEAAIAPFVSLTIRRCTELLERNKLIAADISKLLLIGGSTHSPYISKMLARELGIDLTMMVHETAVVTGAAIFASKQKKPCA